MKKIFFIVSSFALLVLGCADNENETKVNSSAGTSAAVIDDSEYVCTGFYFLSDAPNTVVMQKVHSDETYAINRRPAVTVQNVVDAKLEKPHDQRYSYTDLSLTMDRDGATALKDLTGNPEYLYIAAVVANKLLFVVENSAKITGGKMTVSLVDFTDEEIRKMFAAVKQKK